MANLLLVTNGTGGDVIPFINLGRILKNAGHDVLIFTHCTYKEIIKNNGLGFVSIDSYEEYQEKNDRLCQLSDPINNPDEYLEFNIKYFGADKTYKEYMLISQHCKREDTVILFRHRFGLSALLAAEKYRCPAASIIIAPNYVQHLEVHEQLIGEAMRHEMNKVRGKIGLSDISNWTEWMCSPKLKLALWPKWYGIEEIESINGTASIGFIANEGDNKYEMSEDAKKKVKKFLDSEKKTVLITAGTSKMVNPHLLKIAVESCIKANVNSILVTQFDDFVPNNLPSSVLRLHKAPIKEIMKYANAVIHHGGIGTASEAIEIGIPQLIMPHMVDRPDNADRLRKLGVARVFPVINWQSEILAKSISEIINDEILLLSCKKLAEKIKNDNPKEELCLNVKKLSENREKYQICNVYETNLNDKNLTNNNSNMNNNLSVDYSSEKKKKMLVELLKKKRNKY